MYDESLVLDILEQIIESTKIVKERCDFAKKVDDFYDTKEGSEKLDSICMKLIAIGENLKNIDKITNKELLNSYPQIEWKKIKGIRDFITHHYFDLDADIIFSICQNNINELLTILNLIKKNLEKRS